MTAMPRTDVEVRRDTETGATIYRLGDVESLFACAACGIPFVPVAPGQRTCGSAACRERLRVVTPERAAKARARNARWCAEHRNCKNRQPWLLGQPPHLPHLPGGGMTIDVSPAPTWPIEHRNVRALHGMLTGLVGLPHQRWPEWALVPWPHGIGWGVYFRQDDVARRIANVRTAAVLFDKPVTVTMGPLVRVKAPDVRKRGRSKLRLDTITPVNIECAERAVTHAQPTSASILSAIVTNLPERLGLVGFDKESAMVEVVSHATQTDMVLVGGKWGAVRGWAGHVIVECNAVARWLLEAAARGPGFGGRTAIGFGRIRVREA